MIKRCFINEFILARNEIGFLNSMVMGKKPYINLSSGGGFYELCKFNHSHYFLSHETLIELEKYGFVFNKVNGNAYILTKIMKLKN